MKDRRKVLVQAEIIHRSSCHHRKSTAFRLCLTNEYSADTLWRPKAFSLLLFRKTVFLEKKADLCSTCTKRAIERYIKNYNKIKKTHNFETHMNNLNAILFMKNYFVSEKEIKMDGFKQEKYHVFLTAFSKFYLFEFLSKLTGIYF